MSAIFCVNSNPFHQEISSEIVFCVANLQCLNDPCPPNSRAEGCGMRAQREYRILGPGSLTDRGGSGALAVLKHHV